MSLPWLRNQWHFLPRWLDKIPSGFQLLQFYNRLLLDALLFIPHMRARLQNCLNHSTPICSDPVSRCLSPMDFTRFTGCLSWVIHGLYFYVFLLWAALGEIFGSAASSMESFLEREKGALNFYIRFHQDARPTGRSILNFWALSSKIEPQSLHF